MENKITYEQIKKANDEIQYMKIKRKNAETGKMTIKNYAEVHERVKAFRKVYVNGSIKPELVKFEDNICIYKCTITNNDGELLACATASEKITGNNKKDYINLTNMLENCETSAVGRALGFAGFGVDTAIASAEEVKRAEQKRNPMADMPIQESQKQWLKLNLTEDEIKKAIVNSGKKKLSDLTYLEAERIRDFKEAQETKELQKTKEVF